MAYGQELTGERPLAYTVHVWPTRALIDNSWAWSQRRRDAYAHLTWMVGLAVATQVLRGGSFARQEIEIATSIGCATFTISQAGTTVHVVISAFSPDPDAPGPNGDVDVQPAPVDGLVLGVCPSDRCYYVVVFYGNMSPMPITNTFHIGDQLDINCIVDRAMLAECKGEALEAIDHGNMILQSTLRNFGPSFDQLGYVDIVCNPARHGINRESAKPRMGIDNELSRDLVIKLQELRCVGEDDFKSYRLLLPTPETRSCDPPLSLELFMWQRQPNYIQGGYLH